MKKISKILLLLCVISFAATKTFAQISVGLSISVGIAPPELPVYVQPPCPTEGYLWQPGYWAYDDADGYYWVPGVWVAPPSPGLLWTPAYWGYDGGHYGFHAGYWGASVGFYGGINYGFGYGGYGYGGGRWDGDHFRYNTAVVNVNRTVIHNTYIDNTVIHNTYVNNHTSFNGPGGVTAKPRPEEERAMNERHIPPTSEQMSHQQVASKDRSQFAKVNNGRPAAAAVDRVGGRPFNTQGHVVKNTAFGHQNNEAAGKGPNAERPQQRDNQAAKPEARNESAKPERAPNQERPVRQPQHTAQQHVMQQRVAQQHMTQQHQQQRAPQQQRVPQQRAPQQQHQQQRPPQQHNNPAAHERHR